MIYFSYFANWRKFQKDATQIAICNYPPKGWNGEHRLDLAPPRDSFLSFKDGRCSFSDLITEYENHLAKLNSLTQIKDGSILLCFEKDSKQCHRSALMRKLQALGIECLEL